MPDKRVIVIDGDDAAPEAMIPTIRILESMGLPIQFIRPPIGQAAKDRFDTYFPTETRAAIDASDATLFGATSGASTAALFYLRWGRQTYANVRPAQWLPGFRSPLAHPQGMDFVIVRENLEDLYVGIEGDIADLDSLPLRARHARVPLADLAPGKFAIKAITEIGCERIIRFAFELARKRDGKRKVTVTSKYNMLPISDGYFREIANEVAKSYPDIQHESFIVDDFLARMIMHPEQLDVVVTPNLYGDILSDGAAGLLGGLGLAPSGCFGADYAYFESAHGTAPDIVGQNIINPTATLLSAAMMLEYLEFDTPAARLRTAIRSVYSDAHVLTPDQGGTATTTEFCAAVDRYLAESVVR